MKYVLDRRYNFRGWQNAHTGIHDTQYKVTRFLKKKDYLILLQCDGAHDINLAEIDEESRRLLSDMEKANVIHSAGFGEFLSEEQQYKQYPTHYREQVHWSITGACNLKC